MKSIVSLIVTSSSMMAFAQSSSLKVKVDKLKNTKGHVIAILYDNAEAFPKNVNQAVAVRLIKATDCNSKYIEFNNLDKDKEYAMLIFHDENDDKDCKLNFLGIPKEGIGFSNNFRSRPKFEKGKFKLAGAMTVINIAMWYIF